MSAREGKLITNARVVTPEGVLEDGWVWMQGDRIGAVGAAGQDALPAESDNALRIDGGGGWVLPGFIDMHVHGGAGYDFMDADLEEFRTITRFHARHGGTTGMLATSMTAPREDLTRVLERVARYRLNPMPYAQLLGVHIEGPFVSLKWKGAQNPAYILPPQNDWLEEWVRDYPGLIKLQTLAPETEGAYAYIEKLAENGIIPACGHTDASYEQLTGAAAHGLRHAVHTFNAMRPYHHREPGTVGAVLTDERIMAEVIADGHHVHPGGIRLLVAAKGCDRIILVTDAMAAAGMPDGDYDIGGLPVVMTTGVARLKDGGSLAGSTLTMIEAFRFMIREAGVTVAEASRMASANPARQLGMADTCGTIGPGKRADLLLLDTTLALRSVWIGGVELPD